MERIDYKEIAGILRGLLIRLDDRIPAKDLMLIFEFIDVGELGLALEQMADVLSEDEQPLAADERADMLDLVGRMRMNDRVPTALSLCPTT
ncbi:MafI family immunity protein [bacterium RCC_150]